MLIGDNEWGSSSEGELVSGHWIELSAELTKKPLSLGGESGLEDCENEVGEEDSRNGEGDASRST